MSTVSAADFRSHLAAIPATFVRAKFAAIVRTDFSAVSAAECFSVEPTI